MRLTLLGTGAAGGVPLYGCHCGVCVAAQTRHELRRGACSTLLEVNRQRILIDAGLMNLAERFPSGSIDALLLTHYHPDHIQGLFHLRWGVGPHWSVYGPDDVQGCADLQKNPGLLDFQPPLPPLHSFILGELEITPLPLHHSRPTFGYFFRTAAGTIAYLCDTKGLPDSTAEYLCRQQIDLLVIDCTDPPDIQNSNHNNLAEALAIGRKLKPDKICLDHINHQLDLWLQRNRGQLPSNVMVGQDDKILKM